MSQILKYIDQIGREQNRDVLYIEFDREIYSNYDYEQYEERNNLLKWLKDNDIPYENVPIMLVRMVGKVTEDSYI